MKSARCGREGWPRRGKAFFSFQSSSEVQPFSQSRISYPSPIRFVFSLPLPPLLFALLQFLPYLRSLKRRKRKERSGHLVSSSPCLPPHLSLWCEREFSVAAEVQEGGRRRLTPFRFSHCG
ncbi:hypothetical protein IE53DRAFT_204832 [Violaceomyces palustris]|uniref:Uncharacterized protein n=1 Tax=Violaceomyces palustris TaxID=1673888 RepID=A0ACD0NR04_9BASI|nr:hypothetical protein IE53DRAFT_204832 [Violaceomyces palustris]